jgi:hypothetical protein
VNSLRLGLNLSLLFFEPMKGKKIIFLILALLLPATIFVFLKLFGKNEFQVPILHEDTVPHAANNCDFTYRTPYRVADSIITALDPRRKDSVYVFNFDSRLADPMNRVSTEFADDPVRVVNTADLPQRFEPSFLRECVLLMPPDSAVTIVDNQNRIRGYYDATDRDEVDRLIVEIKIILKQY